MCAASRPLSPHRPGSRGFQAEQALRTCGVTLNRNAIPLDKQPPLITSGIPLDTPAVTTLSMREAELDTIAGLLAGGFDAATAALVTDR